MLADISEMSVYLAFIPLQTCDRNRSWFSALGHSTALWTVVLMVTSYFPQEWFPNKPMMEGELIK